MGQIFRLLRVQLGAAMVDLLSIGNVRRKKPHTIYAGLAFFACVLGSISFFYCYMIGSGLKSFQCVEILPVLVMSVTSIIVLFTTVLKVKGTIFGFRDYDMIMSLPVNSAGIVASRLLLLYAINMIFVAIIMIPMILAYGILTSPDIRFYLIGLILMLILPLIPMILASLLGTLIAFITSRFRHSNILSIILSIGLMLVLVSLSFFTGDSSQELVDMSKALAEEINQIYPLANMFGKAIIDYDLGSLLLFIGISGISFLIYALIVGRLFKKLNTLIMSVRSKASYKMGELRQSTPLKALFQKELRRYFSSNVYVMNTAFGIVLLTAGAIALFFVKPEQLLAEANMEQMIGNLGPIFVVFCISTTCTTASSISLESKSLWIMKSLPVTPRTIFLSKLAVNMLIIAPAFLDALLIGIALDSGWLQMVLSLMIAIAMAVFISIYGLIINLRFPNFNWITEVAVVKQSAASAISIFTGMFISGLLILIISIVPNTILAYSGFIGMMLILDLVLYGILMKWGAKRLVSLI